MSRWVWIFSGLLLGSLLAAEILHQWTEPSILEALPSFTP